MAMNESFDRRLFDRRMFLWAGIGFMALVFLGFAQTYYLKPILASAPLRSLTHAHGIVMTLWVLLFAAQIYLIRSRNVKVHMTLGWAGAALAVIIIVLGLMTSIAAAKYGTQSAPPDIPPLQFMMVPFGDIFVFAVVFGAALFYRKRPAEHKRLMLVTAFNFLPAAIARVPYAPMAQLGPIWFYGVPDLILLAVFAIDAWKNRSVNTVFALAAAFLIASHIFRLMFMSSGPWLAFAEWVTA